MRDRPNCGHERACYEEDMQLLLEDLQSGHITPEEAAKISKKWERRLMRLGVIDGAGRWLQ